MTSKSFTTAIALAAIILSTVVYKQVTQPVEYSAEVLTKFNAWMQKEKRLYGTPSELKMRLATFKANLDKIKLLNSRNSGWTAGLNQFSDLTKSEFKAKYTMRFYPTYNPTKKSNARGKTIHGTYEPLKAPNTFDVRDQIKGKKPVIKNQESCGSCYAFASTTAMEYSLALAGSKKSSYKYEESLAPQEFVDCTGQPNNGCEGGLPIACFEYANQFGLHSEKEYKYKAAQGSCKYGNDEPVVTKTKPTNYERTRRNSPEDMKEKIYNYGAVAVGVETGELQYYENGIFGKNMYDCGLQPNHAVVIIGYGEQNGEKYWIIQNSWSTRWGENGTYRLLRKDENGPGACAVLTDGTYVSF